MTLGRPRGVERFSPELVPRVIPGLAAGIAGEGVHMAPAYVLAVRSRCSLRGKIPSLTRLPAIARQSDTLTPPEQNERPRA